jgi:hypothetical protein
MCAGSVASDTSTLQSPAGSRPQGGVLVSSELAQRVEVVVRQAVRHRSVGSNLPVMFEASACRRESRAVRYSNTPLGVAARALTQDDTCHPDRSQSNVVAFIGCRILRIFVGLPKRSGSMLPVVRHDASSPVARLRYRGIDRRLDFVWRPGGVDRIGRGPTDHTFGRGAILRERLLGSLSNPRVVRRRAFELIAPHCRKMVRS